MKHRSVGDMNKVLYALAVLDRLALANDGYRVHVTRERSCILNCNLHLMPYSTYFELKESGWELNNEYR